MKGSFAKMLAILAGTALSGAAFAYDTVLVTIYKESSFVNQWGSSADSVAQKIFDDAKAYYSSKFGITLQLNRIDTPFFATESGVSGPPSSNGTILNIMRKNVPETVGGEGNTVKTNWLLIYRDTVLAGEVDGIGGLSFGFPNLYINTRERARPDGIFDTTICLGKPARRRTAAEMRRTAIHEFGHLLSARHPNSTSCSNSIMCTPGPAQCLPGGVWQEPAVPADTMDSTNTTRITTHRDCYLTDSNTWFACWLRAVP